jgi:hypothetical protein
VSCSGPEMIPGANTCGAGAARAPLGASCSSAAASAAARKTSEDLLGTVRTA